MNPQCVLCHINLDEISENKFQCPTCKREYIGEFEIMSFSNTIGTAHDSEQDTIELEGIAAIGTPKIATVKQYKDDPYSRNVLEEEKRMSTKGKGSDIPIPKYMQNSDTTKVIDYEEK